VHDLATSHLAAAETARDHGDDVLAALHEEVAAALEHLA